MQSFCPESALDDSGDSQHGARLDGGLLHEGREVGQIPLAQACHCLSAPVEIFHLELKSKKCFLKKNDILE